MSKRYKYLLISLPVIALVIVSALYLHHTGIAVFNSKGPIARQERNLIIFALLLSLVVVIPVYFMLFSFAWKYRESNTKAHYSPDLAGSRIAETIWWVVPTVLITILSVVTWNSSHTLDPYRTIASNNKAITVQVIALDWKWLFVYPEQNIATLNYMQIPNNTPINFIITSDAPMNSFWIPQLGGQVYAMPGMQTQLHLLADSNGSFYGESANISGQGFAGMHFQVVATSAKDFASWVHQVKRNPQQLTQQSYAQIAKDSENNPPSFYASADNSIFNNVIMKYMTPSQTSAAMSMITSGGMSM